MRSAQGSIVNLDDGRWRVFVTIPGTGKRMTKVVHGTRRDADNMRIRMLLKAGYDAESSMTFRDFAENVYLPMKEREVKRGTFLQYSGNLERYAYPAIGHFELSNVKPAAIRMMLDAIPNAPMANYVQTVVHGVLQCAVQEGMIPDNPASKVRRRKAAKHQPKVLTAEQARGYLLAFKGSEIEAAVLLGIGCGLRKGEALALDAEDLGPRIRIARNWVYQAGSARLDTPKTVNSIRSVAVPPSILDRLLEIAPSSGPLVTNGGERMTPGAFDKRYSKIVSSLPADIPRVPFRNLRHTSLTIAYDSGADLLDVSLRAGHSSTSITSDYYVRPKGARDEETARMIDEALNVQLCANPFQREEFLYDPSETIVF